MSKHNHYFKDVSHLSDIDVYRTLILFGVTDPCIQHAVKKLLVAGGRGAGKDISQDIQEAIDSLERWKQMRVEDALTSNYHSPSEELDFPIIDDQVDDGKLKVGDRVKILSVPRDDIRHLVNTIGTVLDVSDEEIEVKTEDNDYWYFDHTDLEKI
jgi:hypothetical protein